MGNLKFSATIFIWLALISIANSAKPTSSDEHNIKVAEDRLSTQVLAIVEHFKQDDPVGIPGAPVPEPMIIPYIAKSLSLANLKMTNISVYGLSKFRIKYSKIDLNSMRASAIIYLKKMHMEGNYSLSAMFTTRNGDFTVDMEDVYTHANMTLGVNIDGKVQTQDIQMDITSDKNIAVDFKNLGMMMAMFQSVINSASNVIFDAVKPFMLNEAHDKISTKINEALEGASKDFVLPNSISPLDMAISEARNKVRKMGYDPFHIPSYNQTAGVFSIQSKNTWVQGVSSFYRVGNITMTMVDKVVTAAFQIGTQKIHGQTQWEVAVGGGLFARAGQASFTLQHLKMNVAVEQPLNIEHRPKIKDLQMELGNIQVRCDGAGTIDYVVEFVVNILPNLLRYQIMDAMENPVKARVQEEMNKFDVEKALHEYLPKFEQLGYKMDFDFKIEL